jgi:predicted Rossmann fold nucleotide-binding protein DprA/Smf involved in DNA uptake
MLIWQQTLNGVTVAGVGNQALLALPMAAFFASRQCPGIAIRAALDWALEQARSKTPVISGFHSPLEQSVLKILLEARSPTVIMLARPVENSRLPPDWKAAINLGNLAVIGPITKTERITEVSASERNDTVAILAEKIVLAHVEPNGTLAKQVERWHGMKLKISNLHLL